MAIWPPGWVGNLDKDCEKQILLSLYHFLDIIYILGGTGRIVGSSFDKEIGVQNPEICLWLSSRPYQGANIPLEDRHGIIAAILPPTAAAFTGGRF